MRSLRNTLLLVAAFLVGTVVAEADNDFAVRVLNDGGMGMGSVVVVGDEVTKGWNYAIIATADHVVVTDDEVSIQYRDGEMIRGGVVAARDRRLDIALVIAVVPSGVEPVELSDEPIEEGDSVSLIGINWREYSGEASPLSFEDHAWTDVVCYPGDSGGPAMLNGKLAGIQSGGLEWAPNEPKRTWPTRTCNLTRLQQMIETVVDEGRWDDELGGVKEKPAQSDVLGVIGTDTSTDGYEDYTPGDEMREGYRMMVFGASWCGPCKALKQELPRMADALRGAGVMGVYYVDSDIHQRFRQMNKIKVYPTIVLMRDGVEVFRVYGFSPSGYLPRILSAIERDKSK